jgi:hypothetical protein
VDAAVLPRGEDVSAEIRAVLGQNITLVYDSLDLQAIDIGKLKNVADIQNKPMLIDTPEMIVVAYPPEPVPIVIQLADRRIRISLSQSSDSIGDIPLWKVATECHNLVPRSSVIAYGFNYDVLVEVTVGNASKLLIDLFIRDAETIRDALQGDLSSFIPRLRFRRGQVSNDLVLEPTDDQRIKVHMNSHFGHKGVELPASEQLEASFLDEYDYLASVLPRLLGEEK